MDASSSLRIISGKAVSGRGNAAFQLDWSDPRFYEALGASPIPGTFNVLLDEPLLLVGDGKEDFTAFHRLFVRGTLEGVGEVLIHRWRGAPLHVLEIVSSRRIRDILGLQDHGAVSLIITEKRLGSLSFAQRFAHLLVWKWREEWYYKHDWYSNNVIIRYIRHHLSQ
jgi:CTP-dependent riboflavin kinase